MVGLSGPVACRKCQTMLKHVLTLPTHSSQSLYVPAIRNPMYSFLCGQSRDRDTNTAQYSGPPSSNLRHSQCMRLRHAAIRTMGPLARINKAAGTTCISNSTSTTFGESAPRIRCHACTKHFSPRTIQQAIWRLSSFRLSHGSEYRIRPGWVRASNDQTAAKTKKVMSLRKSQSFLLTVSGFALACLHVGKMPIETSICILTGDLLSHSFLDVFHMAEPGSRLSPGTRVAHSVPS